MPSSERAQVEARSESEITVSKTNTSHDVDFSAGRGRWKFLSKRVRWQIDEAMAGAGRWSRVVVHSSATDRGNAKVFDYYHRQVRKMRDGLAYHFVIGNGTYSAEGEIEVGHRWSQQLDGGHLQSAAQDEEAIGICLVGDFDKNPVSKAQLEALDELVDYLQAKVGTVELTTHKQINIRPTSCPGRLFPEYVLQAR